MSDEKREENVKKEKKNMFCIFIRGKNIKEQNEREKIYLCAITQATTRHFTYRENITTLMDSHLSFCEETGKKALMMSCGSGVQVSCIAKV